MRDQDLGGSNYFNVRGSLVIESFQPQHLVSQNFSFPIKIYFVNINLEPDWSYDYPIRTFQKPEFFKIPKLYFSIDSIG